MKFKSDIEVQAGLKDSSGANGTSGQVLSSDGATVSWINADIGVASDVQNEVKAGVAINKGQAVYVTGADGTNIIVGLASNVSEATSSKTLGLLNATVPINGIADVVQIGRLSGLNTIGANAGDPVWLGINGNLIYGLANKPYAPANLVFIGIVTRVNANNGEIFINVQNGFELNEIHDVDIKTEVPINGDVLGYNGTLWVNKTIAEWLGYTPVPNSRTITINGNTQDLTANRSWTIDTGIGGSGTTNYVPKFTNSTTIGNSQIFDNGTNVGIGTTSPAEKLQVVGNGLFSNSSTNWAGSANIGLLISGSSSGGATSFISTYLDDTSIQIGAGTSQKTGLIINGQTSALGSSLDFRTGGGTKMFVNSSGNVGIGTSNPTFAKLQVKGDNGSAIAYFFNNTGTAGQVPGVAIEAGTNSSDYALSVANSLGTSYLRVRGDGNVGIGTTSPNRALVVVGGNQEQLVLTSTTTRCGISLNPSNTTFSPYIGSTGNDIVLDTFGTERLRVTTSGNVGIGTTTPGCKLDVNGSLYTNSDFRIGASFSGTGTGIIKNNAGVLSLFTWGDSTNIQIGGNDVVFKPEFGSERMRITSGGNVGIGTTAPAAKLEVAGTIRTGDKTIYNLTIPSPTGNFGNAKAYLRLIPTSTTLITTIRVTISGTWNWSPVFGTIVAEYSFYNVSNTLNFATRTILTANGRAAENLRLGNLEYENGFLSIPIYSVNSNSVSVTIESFTNGLDLSTISYSSWISETLPARNSVFIPTSLGIGTATPTSVLDIREANRVFDGYGNLNIFTTDTGTQNVGGSIALGGDSFGGTSPYPFAKIQGIKEGGGAWAGALILGTTQSNSAVTEKMRITSGGNVGIGTTSPSYPLAVGTTDGPRIGLNASNDRFATAIGSTNVFNVGQRLDFYTGDTGANGTPLGSSNIRMSILPNGNVGIGTSSPSERLEVQNGAAGAKIRVSNSSGGFASLECSSNATSVAQLSFTNQLSLIGGSVGIGTTSPEYRFSLHSSNNLSWLQDTSGSTGATFMLFSIPGVTGIGSITRAGSSNAVAFNTVSDYRLKEDFKQIEGLNLLSKIKVYDFKWKGLDLRMDGVIAHELQEVVPYAVTGEKDAEQMQSVDYSKLVPILIKSIQELKAEIETLKQKL